MAIFNSYVKLPEGTSAEKSAEAAQGSTDPHRRCEALLAQGLGTGALAINCNSHFCTKWIGKYRELIWWQKNMGIDGKKNGKFMELHRISGWYRTKNMA